MKIVICLLLVGLMFTSLAMADDFKIEKEGEKYRITTYAMVEEADSDKLIKVKTGAMATTKLNLEGLLKRVNDNIAKLEQQLAQSQIAKDNIQSRIDTITGIELNDEAK